MLRTLVGRVAGLAIVAVSLSAAAQAGPIASPSTSTSAYYTTGGVGTYGSTWPGAGFGYYGTSGTLLAPGSFTLGQFQAMNLNEGSSLDLTNIPFWISMTVVKPGDGDVTFPGSYSSVLIQGVLNGSLSGPMSSNVLATITSVTPTYGDLPFSIKDLKFITPQTLAPSGINGGLTTLIGYFEKGFQPVPEPTTLAAFGAIVGFAGLRWRKSRLQSLTNA